MLIGASVTIRAERTLESRLVVAMMAYSCLSKAEVTPRGVREGKVLGHRGKG